MGIVRGVFGSRMGIYHNLFIGEVTLLIAYWKVIVVTVDCIIKKKSE